MVYGGSGMTEEIIYEAQQYLTIEKDEGFKRIINIEDLIKRHNLHEVIRFLKEYFRDKEKGLRTFCSWTNARRR